MILSYIKNISTSSNLLQSAYKLSNQLGKSFGVLSFVNSENDIAIQDAELKQQMDKLSLNAVFLSVQNQTIDGLKDICESKEVSFLFLQLTDYTSKSIQRLLKACRELRIPYVLFKDDFALLNPDKVIIPVNFLEEEIEKAQFASAFGRFCNADVKILLANDYGSKAANTAERMKELFDKFDFSYSLVKAQKDSFGVDKEAVHLAANENAGIIIVTASREYGLDDIIFGPKELHLVKKANKPVLLINPRADLYALCD